MICKYCGKELDDSAKVCDACGGALDEKAADPTVPDEVQPQPPKKSNTGRIIWLSALIIVILVGVFALLRFFNKKTEVSPIDRYKSIETASAEAFGEKLGDALEAFGENRITNVDELIASGESKRLDGSLALTFSDEITDSVSKTVGMELSFLKSVGLGFSFAAKDKLASADLSLALDGKELLTAEAVVDPDAQSSYVTLPQLSSTSIKLDMKQLFERLDEIGIKEKLDSALKETGDLPGKDTAKSIINRYTAVALSHVNRVESGTVSLNLEDYTELTSVFDNASLKAMLLDLLQTVKNDTELWTVTDGLTSGTEEKPSAVFAEKYEEYVEGINSIDESVTAEFALCIDSEGKVVRRSILIGEKEIIISCLTEGNKFDIELIYAEGREAVLGLTVNGTCGEKLNADAVLRLEDSEAVYVTLTDISSDHTSGKISVSFSDSTSQLIAEKAKRLCENYGISLEELGIDPLKLSLELELRGEMNADTMLGSSGCTARLLSDGKAIISCDTDLSCTEVDSIAIPENAVEINDSEDIASWISLADVLGFIGTLPQSLSNILMGFLLFGN